MSNTGLDVFDKTLQTTHIWLDELMQVIGPDRHLAWHVMGVVLPVLPVCYGRVGLSTGRIQAPKSAPLLVTSRGNWALY
jgi:hypothetical protein